MDIQAQIITAAAVDELMKIAQPEPLSKFMGTATRRLNLARGIGTYGGQKVPLLRPRPTSSPDWAQTTRFARGATPFRARE